MRCRRALVGGREHEHGDSVSDLELCYEGGLGSASTLSGTRRGWLEMKIAKSEYCRFLVRCSEHVTCDPRVTGEYPALRPSAGAEHAERRVWTRREGPGRGSKVNAERAGRFRG